MSREALFQAAKRKAIEVAIPDTDEVITLHELKLGDRQKMFSQQSSGMEALEIMALAIVLSCPDLNEEDAALIVEEWRESVIIHLGTKILELNGMSPGAVEDAEKNSESDQS